MVVANKLPPDYPLVSEGISIHWHGFSMGGAEWYDGVGYLAQCPIRAGTNFTYRFQVGYFSFLQRPPVWLGQCRERVLLLPRQPFKAALERGWAGGASIL